MPKLTPEVLQAKRDDILQAAGRVFAEKGYDRTTVKDLEHATGLSRGGIFAHFAGKRDVYRAAVEQFLGEGLMPAIREAAREATSAEEALIAAYRAGVAWHAAHPEARRLFDQIRLVQDTEPELAALDEQTTALVRQAIVQNVQERQAGGLYRSDMDPETAAEVIHILMDRLIADSLTQPRHQAEANARRVFSVIADGLASRGVPGSTSPHSGLS